MRIFIALSLPKNIENNIQQQIKPLFNYSHLHWATGKNLHLTVSFLGELSLNQVNNLYTLIPPITSSFKAFKIELNKLFYLPDENTPRILAISLKNTNKLEKIHQSIEAKVDELKLTPQGWKEFRPHITLAKIKVFQTEIAKSISDKINQALCHQQLEVNSLEVMHSILSATGPDYKILRSFSLNSMNR